MRRVIGAALAAACLLLAPSGAFAQAKTWTTVRIATEGAFAPYNFTGPGGKLEGYEIDLAADLCARMKVKCEMSAQDWDGIIPGLQSGKYDAIMAAMSITPKRAEVVAFSRPYGGEPSAFAAAKDSPLAKLPHSGERLDFTTHEAEAAKAIDDMKPMLKGKVLGVQVATIQANFADKYLKDTVDIREYKTIEQHNLDLEAGRIDIVLASGGTVRSMLEKPEFKNLTLVGPRVSGGVFGLGPGVAMRKSDPELKKMFDDAIGAAIADGTIKRLSTKWFGIDLTPQG